MSKAKALKKKASGKKYTVEVKPRLHSGSVKNPFYKKYHD
jgi:hypothetical protein